jgi:hypothetical protein
MLGKWEAEVTAKFSSYNEVLNPLVEEAVSCSPESWSKGTLTIDCDGSYLNYKLKNDESPEKAQISDALRGLCEEFYVVMRQAGDVWVTAAIHFSRNEGTWSFKVGFKYPDLEPVRPAKPDASPESAARNKPWWRLW